MGKIPEGAGDIRSLVNHLDFERFDPKTIQDSYRHSIDGPFEIFIFGYHMSVFDHRNTKGKRFDFVFLTDRWLLERVSTFTEVPYFFMGSSFAAQGVGSVSCPANNKLYPFPDDCTSGIFKARKDLVEAQLSNKTDPHIRNLIDCFNKYLGPILGPLADRETLKKTVGFRCDSNQARSNFTSTGQPIITLGQDFLDGGSLDNGIEVYLHELIHLLDVRTRSTSTCLLDRPHLTDQSATVLIKACWNSGPDEKAKLDKALQLERAVHTDTTLSSLLSQMTPVEAIAWAGENQSAIKEITSRNESLMSNGFDGKNDNETKKKEACLLANIKNQLLNTSGLNNSCIAGLVVDVPKDCSSDKLAQFNPKNIYPVPGSNRPPINQKNTTNAISGPIVDTDIEPQRLLNTDGLITDFRASLAVFKNGSIPPVEGSISPAADPSRWPVSVSRIFSILPKLAYAQDGTPVLNFPTTSTRTSSTRTVQLPTAKSETDKPASNKTQILNAQKNQPPGSSTISGTESISTGSASARTPASTSQAPTALADPFTRIEALFAQGTPPDRVSDLLSSEDKRALVQADVRIVKDGKAILNPKGKRIYVYDQRVKRLVAR
jgi:hypothetical protein